MALEIAGRSARRMGVPALVAEGSAEVVLVRNGPEVLSLWRARGYRGRVIVHVGRFLHFVEPSRADHLQYEDLTRVGSASHLVDDLAALASNENYLWAAAEVGVAREVLFTEPARSLRARASALDMALADGQPLDLESRGFSRSVGAELPRVDEPVLLDIGASYFDEGTGEDLLRLLESSGLRTDLVTLHLLQGNDDVSDAARNRLEAFRSAIARERRR